MRIAQPGRQYGAISEIAALQREVIKYSKPAIAHIVTRQGNSGCIKLDIRPQEPTPIKPGTSIRLCRATPNCPEITGTLSLPQFWLLAGLTMFWYATDDDKPNVPTCGETAILLHVPKCSMSFGDTSTLLII